MKKTIVVLLILCSSLVQAEDNYILNWRPLRTILTGQKMLDGRVYYMPFDTMEVINNMPGGCGLELMRESAAYLYIGEGQRLTIHAGNGLGMIPGGAGIRVPASSTLYIVGGGTLDIYGGDGGRGTIGLIGLPGLLYIDSLKNYYYKGGLGGIGGSGGGGAGAGIGSRGSAGAMGGWLARDTLRSVKENFGGVQGHNGGNSSSTADCGKIYVVGNLKVNVYGGEADTTVKRQSFGFPSYLITHAQLFAADHVIGGGGGGGNGNNGQPGAAIGGGGPGAAGAGGGASGGTVSVRRASVEHLLGSLAQKMIVKDIQAMLQAIAKDGSPTVKVLLAPLLSPKARVTAGDVIAWALRNVLGACYPLQPNGAGGQGSYISASPAREVDGGSFWQGDFRFDGYEETVFVHCPDGGKMGQFGTQGGRTIAMRTPLAGVNQPMDILTEDKRTAELKEALTYRLQFVNVNVDMSQAHDTCRYIFLSDTLPQRVTVPTPLLPGEFLGYCDLLGNYWYDKDGKLITNTLDTLGRGVRYFLRPKTQFLLPCWDMYKYIFIVHNEELIDSSTPENRQYGIYSIEWDTIHGTREYTARAIAIPQTMPKEPSKTVLVENMFTTIKLHYYHTKALLSWELPGNMTIVDKAGEYTPSGAVFCGDWITAPTYAKDMDGKLYELSDWVQKGTGEELGYTMPDEDVTYTPTCTALPSNITFYCDPWKGEVNDESKELFERQTVQVSPYDGYELDTSYIFYATNEGVTYEQLTELTDNKLLILASPQRDSAVVLVNFRGVKHQLNYNELGERRSSMTLYINSDSICNDGGMKMTHTVRNEDRVWIAPQPDKDHTYVCKELRVVTASGEEIEVEENETYDQNNRYLFYYSFVMPNEDVTVTADYGVLDDELIPLRMRCDTGSARVFSSRGLELPNHVLFADKGYKLDAEQLVWFQLLDPDTLAIDSIRLRYHYWDGSYEYDTPNRYMFFQDNKDYTHQPVDTTIAPTTAIRYGFQMPSLVQDVLLEVHHKGVPFEWEEEDEHSALHNVYTDPNNTIYDLLGTSWGDNPPSLPKGVYIRGKKKMIIY